MISFNSFTHSCQTFLGSSCFLNTGRGGGGGGWKNLVGDGKKITTPHSCTHKNQTTLKHVKKVEPLPQAYIFHENSLFITFIKNVCSRVA